MYINVLGHRLASGKLSEEVHEPERRHRHPPGHPAERGIEGLPRCRQSRWPKMKRKGRCGIGACLVAAAALLFGGCRGQAHREPRTGRLPFSVRLKDLTVKPASSEGGTATDPEAAEAPAIPAAFEGLPGATEAIARVLEKSGVFTRVVPQDDRSTPVDLELEIWASGNEFGPGTPTAWGAISSTLAWLLAGHLSWFIDNRTYPESDVTLNLAVRPVISAPGRSGSGRAPEVGRREESQGPAGEPVLSQARAPVKGSGKAAPRQGPAAKRAPAPPPATLFTDAVRLRGLRLSFL